MSNSKSPIILIAIAVILTGVLVYCTPISTDIDLTLNAAKVDLYGNEVGSAELVLKGQRLDYLFQPSRLDVDIGPFDDAISYITASTYQGKFGEVEGYIYSYDFMEIQNVHYGAYLKHENYITIGTLYFSPDMTRFAFFWHNLDTYFVASADDAYSTSELVEYFSFLFREPPDETEAQ